MEREKLITLDHVSKHFHVGKGQTLVAVNDISLDIYKGETLGVVGESGCGKSTLGRVVMGIYEATKGTITFEGKKLDLRRAKDKMEYARKAQIVFQDPYASLNPRMLVGSIIAEGMEIHNMYDREKRQERVYELLETVGLNREHANRFPHEFSGGQRQRIGIARALAVEPEFIVCDEPISALDVSIQRYLGNLVELADSEEIYAHTLHPYSQALLASVPIPDPDREAGKETVVLKGDVPSPINPKPGCPFAGRCPHVMEKCRKESPQLKEVRPNQRATWRWNR